MNIDKQALKKIVDEIEASRARQRAETEHQREVMKRAKAHQLDAKAIRIVLQRRAMGDTKRDEQDYYVHAYELALGGKKDAMEALERGATVREAAAAGGISRGAAGNLAKSVQKSSIVDTEHADAEADDDAAPSSGSEPQGAAEPEQLSGSSVCGGQAGPESDAGPGTERQGPDERSAPESAPALRVAPGPQDPLKPCWSLANAIAEQERIEREEAKRKRDARRAELAAMLKPTTDAEWDSVAADLPPFLKARTQEAQT